MDERIRATNGVALQRAKPCSHTIGRTKQRRFLEHLAATCNVRRSARAVGVGVCTVYGIRQRDPAFAAAWKEAIAAGYDRLEEVLLARALAEVEPVEFDPGTVETVLVEDEAAPPPDAERGPKSGHRVPGSGIDGKVALVEVQLALALLNRRLAATREGRVRNCRRRATAEEVEQAINTKLDKLAARLDRQK